MTEVYWNIPEKVVVTPTDLLSEQANALTSATRGILRGEVRSSQSAAGQIEIALYIVVPAMNEYRYKLFDYEPRDVLLYPGRGYDYHNEAWYEIEDENGFRSCLKAVLSSESTGSIIGSLLAQGRAAAKS